MIVATPPRDASEPPGDGAGGATLRVVTQNDHAHLAGRLLALWRREGLPDHPRRDDLLFAVREHDNGWREADSAPYCDPATGRPHDFLSLPDPVRREVWRRGVARYRESRPYAALLVTRHALALHRGKRDDPAWRETLEEWDETAAELLAASGVDAADADADYRWLDLADALSLAVCAGWREPLARGGYAARPDGDVLALAPFPLAGTTRFAVPCRTIPDRRYRGDADLAVELAAARWREATVRVVPA